VNLPDEAAETMIRELLTILSLNLIGRGLGPFPFLDEAVTAQKGRTNSVD